eukprot:772891-Prymnesium_polylepis.1
MEVVPAQGWLWRRPRIGDCGGFSFTQCNRPTLGPPRATMDAPLLDLGRCGTRPSDCATRIFRDSAEAANYFQTARRESVFATAALDTDGVARSLRCVCAKPTNTQPVAILRSCNDVRVDQHVLFCHFRSSTSLSHVLGLRVEIKAAGWRGTPPSKKVALFL